MYPTNEVKSSEARLCDLPQVISEILDVNERTSATIQGIRNALCRIKSIQEQPKIEKDIRPNPVDDSFIGGMQIHLSFARRNADNLDDLLRHLNSLV